MEWYDDDERINHHYLPLVREESEHAWGFLEDGQLVSLPTEESAALLAESFPDTICFFADTVSHPNIL